MKKLLMLTSAAVLGLSACSGSTDADETRIPQVTHSDGGASEESTTEGTTNDSSTGSGSERTSGGLAAVSVSVADAITTAQDVAGGGDLTSISLDDERGGYVYDLTIQSGGTQWDIEVDANTGEVIKRESEQDDDTDPVVDPASPMTPEQAIEVARGVHDGEVESWSLDSDDGRIEYDIDFVGDTDVIVDVETGEARLD